MYVLYFVCKCFEALLTLLGAYTFVDKLLGIQEDKKSNKKEIHAAFIDVDDVRKDGKD